MRTDEGLPFAGQWRFGLFNVSTVLLSLCFLCCFVVAVPQLALPAMTHQQVKKLSLAQQRKPRMALALGDSCKACGQVRWKVSMFTYIHFNSAVSELALHSADAQTISQR